MEGIVRSAKSIAAEVDRGGRGKDNKEQVWFTIGDLAREFDVTLRTLRFYEDKGLLDPRREGLNRYYGRRDRARLSLILMGKRVGFSLTEIKEMLDLYDLNDNQATQLRVALKKFNEQIGVLEAQKRQTEQALDELNGAVRVVADMLKSREAAASKA